MILISYFTNTGTPARSISYLAPLSALTQKREKTVRAGYDKTICFVCELSVLAVSVTQMETNVLNFIYNQNKYSKIG